MQKIRFYFHDRKPILKERKRLKQFIEGLFVQKKQQLESLSYIFCSDKYLVGINKEFLKHDFFTDVITFNLSLNRYKTEAEVYVSVDRIKDNAKQEGVSFNKELHRVIFHGALHLCRYKDKNKTDQKRMRLAENRHLNKYFK